MDRKSSVDPFEELTGLKVRKLVTYKNKNKIKKPMAEKPEDIANDNGYSEKIVKWLLDSQNKFDKLSQTQSIVSNDDEIPADIDMPSVSQVSKRTPYNTRSKSKNPLPTIRASSLNIHVNKNQNKVVPKKLSRSLSCETRSVENYHIDDGSDVNQRAIDEQLIVSGLEDAFLNNIENEVLKVVENKKNDTKDSTPGRSGWDRLKKIRKTIRKKSKTPKKLDVTITPSQKSHTPKCQKFPIVELAKFEDFVAIEITNNFGCLRDNSKSDPIQTYVMNKPAVSPAGNIKDSSSCGNLENLPAKIELDQHVMERKVVSSQEKSEDNSFKSFQKLFSEMQVISGKLCLQQLNMEFSQSVGNYLNELKMNIEKGKLFFEKLNESNNHHDSLKSSSMSPYKLNNNQIVDVSDKSTQTFVDCCNEAVQTIDIVLCDKNMQCDQPILCHKDLQTDDYPTSVQMPQIPNDKVDMIENSRPEDCNDMHLESLEVFKGEILKSETCQFVDNVVSNPILPERTNDLSCKKILDDIISNKGQLKRFRTDEETYTRKRPCHKFILSDVSIDFETETNPQNLNSSYCCERNEKNAHDLSNDVFSKFNDTIKGTENQKSTRRTQEIIEECDIIIQNARKNKENIIETLETSSDVLFLDKQIDEDLNRFKENQKVQLNNSRKCNKVSRSLFPESVTDCCDNIKNAHSNSHSMANVLKEIDCNVLMDQDECDEDNDVTIVPKINVLQNVIVKQSDATETNSESNDEVVFSDEEVIETTPQKPRKQLSREFALDITLPPPIEFQDERKEDAGENCDDSIGDQSVIDLDTSSIDMKSQTPKRLSKFTKVTSTPHSQAPESEKFSLSPIRIEKKSSNGTRRKSKFTPLTKFSLKRSGTPKSKQSSILSFINSTQDSDLEIGSNVSSLSLLSSTTKPCLACTRLKKDQLISVSALTNKKLVTYSSVFSDQVTHMIVSVNKENCVEDHTLKFVCAVAAGIWVLRFEWVKECLAKNYLIPEEPYEALDVSGAEGPKLSRLRSKTNRLLKGFKIYVAPPFSSTSVEEVQNVISLLGGIVATRPEDLLDKDKKNTHLIITEAKATQNFSLYETWLEILKVITVDIEWLSRSVGQYKLQSLKSFSLCSDDSVDQLNYPAELMVDEPISFSQNEITC